MTPKEAFYKVLERSEFAYVGHDDVDMVIKALTELEELKRYPTSDEVCEALNTFDDFDNVEYDDKTRTFYSGEIICYSGRYECIIFNYDLPPHLITLIGRFYEGMEKICK